MTLIGHHFVDIEIMGRHVPVGPAEHALVYAISGVALLLMAYGAYAVGRDLWHWRRSRLAQADNLPAPPGA